MGELMRADRKVIRLQIRLEPAVTARHRRHHAVGSDGDDTVRIRQAEFSAPSAPVPYAAIASTILPTNCACPATAA